MPNGGYESLGDTLRYLDAGTFSALSHWRVFLIKTNLIVSRYIITVTLPPSLQMSSAQNACMSVTVSVSVPDSVSCFNFFAWYVIYLILVNPSDFSDCHCNSFPAVSA